MPKKHYLFTPGPTPVPPAVSAAESRPLIHHRTAEFSALFEAASRRLQWLFDTAEPVLVLTGSGTCAMEAALVNLMRRGGQVLVVLGGKFGERWGEIARAYGLEIVPLDVPWGETLSADQLEAALAEHPQATAVCLTQVESSTGVLFDIQALVRVAQRRGALAIVDGITGIGAHRFHFDAWKVDAAVCGSQKALGMPPGLAFVALSPRAWEAAERCDLPRYYLDLRAYRKALRDATTPFTPAISLVAALEQALIELQQTGLEPLWRRHQILADATRLGAQALGLELLAKADPCNILTTILAPPNVDVNRLLALLRDDLGVSFVGGQGPLKGRILRIGHLGFFNPFDIVTALAALETGLHRLGYEFTIGAGVRAAHAYLIEHGAEAF